MLDSLDTLIAFAVVMTVVSLLITVAVQMLSALFNLRGKNLAQGLVETFLTVGGNKADDTAKITQTEAEQLAGYLLTRTGLSDHAFNSSGSISNSADRAKYAANPNPLGGFGGWFNWTLAAAVRPDEIFSAVRELARLPVEGKDRALIDIAKKLLTGVGVDSDIVDEAAKKKAELKTLTENLASAMREAAAAAGGQAAQDAFQAQVATLQVDAEAALREVTNEAIKFAQGVEAGYERFKFWFESGQDRAQQWFTTNTRCFTMGLAFVFAFAFQLDTVEIYRDLVRNPTKAKAIAAQAGGIIAQGESILAEKGNLYEAAITGWIAQQGAGAEGDAARAKLQPLTSLQFEPTDTRDSANAKVLAALGGSVPAEVQGKFEDSLDKVASASFNASKDDYLKLRTAFDKAGFEIIPASDGWRWGEHWCDDLHKHLFGILFTAALLTLGAPFWFNTLKSLTNLRSALANELDPQNPNKPKSPIDPATGKSKTPPGPTL